MTEPIPFPINPYVEGIDQKTLPFREWIDSEYNQEKWDAGKGKASIKVPKSPKSPSEPSPEALFEDPQELYLPKSFANEVCQWKRPPDVFFDVKRAGGVREHGRLPRSDVGQSSSFAQRARSQLYFVGGDAAIFGKLRAVRDRGGVACLHPDHRPDALEALASRLL
ncbi:unnamed protein product [Brassicogethes aeneus]|uniref:Uncharacterized protein n=1 Tax=Brassicogethes aeneus TaxID=1431903 RepID=A0A9P0B2W5_BRAAE|nr:unnamed protein product [Brassicogethes aeneus]